MQEIHACGDEPIYKAKAATARARPEREAPILVAAPVKDGAGGLTGPPVGETVPLLVGAGTSGVADSSGTSEVGAGASEVGAGASEVGAGASEVGAGASEDGAGASEDGAGASEEDSTGLSPPGFGLLPGAQILAETSRVFKISALSVQEVVTQPVALERMAALLAVSQEQAISSAEQSVSEAIAFWRHGRAQAGKSARVTWAETPAAKAAARRTAEYFMLTVVR